MTFARAGRPLYYVTSEEGWDADGCLPEVRSNRQVIGGDTRRRNRHLSVSGWFPVGKSPYT
ncbi:MAG: hypothetical protein NZ585_08170 [Chloracidobacterium sp.]|nr:hypothetical protein [Chloracidobacterium sp.]MDW8218013.1 hypothetical protein [Acidobacteriota bacterium]